MDKLENWWRRIEKKPWTSRVRYIGLKRTLLPLPIWRWHPRYADIYKISILFTVIFFQLAYILLFYFSFSYLFLSFLFIPIFSPIHPPPPPNDSCWCIHLTASGQQLIPMYKENICNMGFPLKVANSFQQKRKFDQNLLWRHILYIISSAQYRINSLSGRWVRPFLLHILQNVRKQVVRMARQLGHDVVLM